MNPVSSQQPIDCQQSQTLLLCCGRIKLGAIKEQLRGLLCKDIDWNELIQLAQQNGMLPLLYWHLHRVCPEAVPSSILADLQGRFSKNMQRNLRLTGALLKLLKCLNEQNIPALPFKGPVLASEVYGNLALRSFADLDILVHKKDVLPAKEALESLGYHLHPALPRLSRVRERRLLHSHNHLSLRHDCGGGTVELHWHFAPHYFGAALDSEALWARLTTITLVDKPVLSLAHEELLLFLCIHGAKHIWSRLEWIVSVAELIKRTPKLDWVSVRTQAKALKCERMLSLGLFLASDLLGAPLPKDIHTLIHKDFTVRSLATQVKVNLFTMRDRSETEGEDMLFHLRAKIHWDDKLRYCIRAAFIPTALDWEAMPLPDSLSSLYYLIRPLRLLKQFRRPLRKKA